uniref:adrenocortical dysplasia protein homolog n=1 Tax=Semicossyphus pulcher TaxID=241346 RepID=UPI0037E7E666
MSRAARNKLSPWIESLILSYGSQDEGGSMQLKAHVIGVGQMSQSQAQGSDGPTGLLFLSDGVLQIPAILTAAAWDNLQDKEERECFTSLLNTTVCIQDYQLQFQMTPEQTKCRFFLSVGELAATSAGPVKDNTPCCTTLPSVRQKICKTWRALLGQEGQGSQSQCGFDLTELLGEWEHDCLQAVLEDVRERLTGSSHPVNPQPSTSTYTSSLPHQDTSTATSWDVDRVTYKRETCFTVPINSLLIPEGDAQQLQTPLNVESKTPSGLSADLADNTRDLPQVCKLSETAQSSDDDVEWQTETSALVMLDCDVNENLRPHVEDDVLDEDMITRLNESEIRPLSNPWDIFSPPGVISSSTDESPEATQTHPHVAIFTSTQLPVHSSKETQQTSDQNSKGEHSDLLPYQNPPNSASLPITVSTLAPTSVSPPERFTRPASLSPDTEEQRTDVAKLNRLALEQESQIFEDVEETVERKCMKAKRKRSDPQAEAQTILDEEDVAQISGSPPSWLFDSKSGSGAEEGSGLQHGQTMGTDLKKTSTVHSDGKLFSYSYQVSGKNLQDFSQFKVAESLLNWAVKYLVTPQQTEDPNSTSAASNQTSSDRTEVTLL